MKLWHGPTGRTVRGHVLDVSLPGFTRALKDYDKQLYAIWNPTKLKGWGCWEIRRLPNKKTAVYQGTHKGAKYYSLEYRELDHVHHVLDAAFLNYDAIRKIKEMDVFSMYEKAGIKPNEEGAFDKLTEYYARKYEEKILEDASTEMRYAIKQNKSAINDFYELVRSGVSPAQILMSVNWAQNS